MHFTVLAIAAFAALSLAAPSRLRARYDIPNCDPPADMPPQMAEKIRECHLDPMKPSCDFLWEGSAFTGDEGFYWHVIPDAVCEGYD